MAPASTSCMATVTGLWAVVSTRGRAPRCNCLQRSPATEMNSNLFPIFSVAIMEPPQESRSRSGILDEKVLRIEPSAERARGGRSRCRMDGLGEAGEVAQDRVQDRPPQRRPAARRQSDRAQLPVGGFEVVVDDHVVIGGTLLDLPTGRSQSAGAL